MNDLTQTITAKAWNGEGSLVYHFLYTFRGYRDRSPEIGEIVGRVDTLPFHCGMDARSIARRWIPAAESVGLTASVEVDGEELPSKWGDSGDLMGMEYVWGR